MVLHLSGEMDYEMFDRLLKEYSLLKEKEKLVVYFTSTGGLVDVAVAMIDFINTNKSTVEIVFYGELFSAGMILFLSVECKKKILPDTRGMYHYAYQDMAINESGKPNGDYDIFSMKEMKKAKEKTIAFLKNTKLTDKEINLVKKGKDVYFSHERMLEIIN